MQEVKGRKSDVVLSCRAYIGTVEYLSVKIIGVIAVLPTKISSMSPRW